MDIGTVAGNAREFRDKNITCFQSFFYTLSTGLAMLSFLMFCTMFEVITVNSHIDSLKFTSWQLVGATIGFMICFSFIGCGVAFCGFCVTKYP